MEWADETKFWMIQVVPTNAGHTKWSPRRNVSFLLRICGLIPWYTWQGRANYWNAHNSFRFIHDPINCPVQQFTGQFFGYYSPKPGQECLPEKKEWRDENEHNPSSSGAKTRAVTRIIKAIKEAGDVSQQALALQSTLIHLDIRAIAKTFGYDLTLSSYSCVPNESSMQAHASCPLDKP
jgi:hypothetical protein